MIVIQERKFNPPCITLQTRESLIYTGASYL